MLQTACGDSKLQSTLGTFLLEQTVDQAGRKTITAAYSVNNISYGVFL
jgi:hypothetical protein